VRNAPKTIFRLALKKGVQLIAAGGHLTDEGLAKIKSLKDRMNDSRVIPAPEIIRPEPPLTYAGLNKIQVLEVKKPASILA
jgi:hypothetical protein